MFKRIFFRSKVIMYFVVVIKMEILGVVVFIEIMNAFCLEICFLFLLSLYFNNSLKFWEKEFLVPFGSQCAKREAYFIF